MLSKDERTALIEKTYMDYHSTPYAVRNMTWGHVWDAIDSALDDAGAFAEPRPLPTRSELETHIYGKSALEGIDSMIAAGLARDDDSEPEPEEVSRYRQWHRDQYACDPSESFIADLTAALRTQEGR